MVKENIDASAANEALEISLIPALTGDKQAIESFYRAFLLGPLYVGNRKQDLPLSSLAKYPSDFLDLLAVRDGERAIIPVFSRPTLIFDWCGQNLSWRNIPTKTLLQLTPEDWWLCINPSSEVEKEISPWEIEHLRSGEDSIADILQDFEGTEPMEGITVVPLEAQEHESLKCKLIAYAKKQSTIVSMSLLRQEGIGIGGDKRTSYILGIRLRESFTQSKSLIETEIRSIAEQESIGNEPIKVLFSGGTSVDLISGLTSDASEFYHTSNQKKSLLFKALKALKP